MSTDGGRVRSKPPGGTRSGTGHRPRERAGQPATLVLGVDPGLTATGYGLIEPGRPHPRLVAFGCLRTSPRTSVPERLSDLYHRLSDLIADHGPAHVAVESGFYGKNARSAMLVGQARGVALLAAVRGGCSVSEYTPTEVKRAVVGTGSASKQQVQFMVQALLGLQEAPHPDHASDALAVAICHLHSYDLRQLGD